LAQRFDYSNIPIDDQYLFMDFGGEHDASPLEVLSFTIR
jgi:hypothetical protein